MQRKGIVMQVAGDLVIVMTKDRQFLKIPWADGMVVGQEIDVPEAAVNRSASARNLTSLPWYKRTWNTAWKRTGVIAATVLLAASVWTSTALFSEPTAYAYVTVDINPSIELSIDNHRRVVAAVPLNDEAKEILEGQTLKSMAVEDAVGKLAEIARSRGYLKEKTEVIITASPAVADDLLTEDLNLNKVESELVAHVESIMKSAGDQVEVGGIVVSKDVRESAQSAGLSAGKYALYLAAMQSGIQVDLEEMKNKSISKLVDQRGQKLGEVLRDLKGGKQLDDWNRQVKDKAKGTSQGVPNVVPSNVNNRQQEQKSSKQNGKQEWQVGKQQEWKNSNKSNPEKGDQKQQREKDWKTQSPQPKKWDGRAGEWKPGTSRNQGGNDKKSKVEPPQNQDRKNNDQKEQRR